MFRNGIWIIGVIEAPKDNQKYRRKDGKWIFCPIPYSIIELVFDSSLGQIVDLDFKGLEQNFNIGVDWGDGNFVDIPPYNHTFPDSNKIYTVKIYNLPYFPDSFYNNDIATGKNLQNLIEVHAKGSIISVGVNAFRANKVLSCVDLDKLNNSSIYLNRSAFSYCSNIDEFNLDLSKITELLSNQSNQSPNLNTIDGVFAYAFAQNSAVELNFSSLNFKTLGNMTFWFSNVKKIFFNPNAEFSLGIGAFANCTNLTDLILGIITDIGGAPNYTLGGTFYNTKNLMNFSADFSKITSLPDGYIDSSRKLGVFYNAFSMSSKIALEFNNPNFTLVGSQSFTESGLHKINFNPNAIFAIGARAFNGCTNLTEIVLGKVTNIGAAAFMNCSAITKFTGDFSKVSVFADGYSDLYPINGVFSNAFAPGSHIQLDFTSQDIVRIGNQCFMGSKIWKINFSSLSNFAIGTLAFYNCTELVEINLGGVSYIGANAFLGVTSLKVFTGDFSNITVIEDGYNIAGNDRGTFARAFDPSSNIELNFTNSGFTKLGSMAFRESNIYKVSFNRNASFTVGFQAFANAKKLIYLDLGGATQLMDGSLSGIPTLQILRIGNPNPPLFGTITINTTSLQKISVPAASVSDYKGATGWIAYANLIVGDY